MATTTYTVLDQNDTVVAEGISKKSKAVEQAVALKKSTRKTHRVLTSSGTEVHVEKGTRGMKITPRYSRTVALPEGVKAPKNARVAYLRSRHDAAILAFDGDEGTTYSVLRLSSGEIVADGFEKTREAGAHVLTMSKPVVEAAPVEA